MFSSYKSIGILKRSYMHTCGRVSLINLFTAALGKFKSSSSAIPIPLPISVFFQLCVVGLVRTSEGYPKLIPKHISDKVLKNKNWKNKIKTAHRDHQHWIVKTSRLYPECAECSTFGALVTILMTILNRLWGAVQFLRKCKFKFRRPSPDSCCLLSMRHAQISWKLMELNTSERTITELSCHLGVYSTDHKNTLCEIYVAYVGSNVNLATLAWVDTGHEHGLPVWTIGHGYCHWTFPHSQSSLTHWDIINTALTRVCLRRQRTHRVSTERWAALGYWVGPPEPLLWVSQALNTLSQARADWLIISSIANLYSSVGNLQFAPLS